MNIHDIILRDNYFLKSNKSKQNLINRMKKIFDKRQTTNNKWYK